MTAQTSLSESIFIAKEISRMVGGIDMLDAHSRTPGLLDTARSFADIAVLLPHQSPGPPAGTMPRKKRESLCGNVGREDYLDHPAVQGTTSPFSGPCLNLPRVR